MKPSEYIPLALRTVNDLGHEGNIDHACMLLLSEAGEVVDVVKKNFAYGRPLDTTHLMEELGDYMWGLNLLLKEMDKLSMWSIMEANCVLCSTTTNVNLSVWGQQSDYSSTVRCVSQQTCCHAGPAIFLGAFTGNMVQWIKFNPGGAADENFELGFHHMCRHVGYLLALSGLTLDQVLDANIAKLEARYPDLRFDPDRAINRDLEAEKGVLDVHS